METHIENRSFTLHPVVKMTACLSPLWLLSLTSMVEGFPRPPISLEVALVTLVIAIGVGILLVWKKWMTIELFVYSLFPFLLVPVFDEISTTYKTQFIILCAVILTIGAIVYHRSRANRSVRGLILLAFAVVTYLTARHAASNYWEIVSGLGYGPCFPDASDCAPLTGQEPRPWMLFFGF